MVDQEMIDSEICRDDRCMRLDVHKKHWKREWAPQASSRKTSSKKLPWQQDDPRALVGAVARATSRAYPMCFSAIAANVRDDYGQVHDRTIYRHLRTLVDRGHLIKLDLRLPMAAYIRPKSRLLHDLESLREYILGTIEQLGAPCSSNVKRKKSDRKSKSVTLPEDGLQ